MTAKRAPEPLQGVEWVVISCSARYPRMPFGSGRAPVPSPCSSAPRKPASWPIRARFNLFYVKLSQNGEVSLKYVQKACHTPYFQNRPQKSPLEILRIPFSVAFSHKELMAYFSRGSGFIVKNDEVSTSCAHVYRHLHVPDLRCA